MKLVIDPMPALRTAAEGQINRYFSNIAAATLHQDFAHATKRAQATSILNGGTASPELTEEAVLRGVSPTDLAQVIASKPDLAAGRELDRQKMMLAVAGATVPDELEAILANTPV